jgi:hypothetical protein
LSPWPRTIFRTWASSEVRPPTRSRLRTESSVRGKPSSPCGVHSTHTWAPYHGAAADHAPASQLQPKSTIPTSTRPTQRLQRSLRRSLHLTHRRSLPAQRERPGALQEQAGPAHGSRPRGRQEQQCKAAGSTSASGSACTTGCMEEPRRRNSPSSFGLSGSSEARLLVRGVQLVAAGADVQHRDLRPTREPHPVAAFSSSWPRRWRVRLFGRWWFRRTRRSSDELTPRLCTVI